MLSKRAFTLIELIFVIVIMTIITTISFYFLSKVNKKEALEKDVASLSALMRDGRLLSVTSKDASTFGIHLTSGQAVLFEGSSYVPGGSNEKVVVYSKYVYMSGSSLNLGTSDIIFDRLTGATTNYGTVTLSLVDNTSSTTITVLRTGVLK